MYIIKEGIRNVSILPIGLLDLKTGKNKVLDNVYKTWSDGDTTAEFWDTGDKKVVIFTSGKNPLFKKGETQNFKHDQNFRYLFTGTLTDWCSLEKLSTFTKYGYKLYAYVYK